MNYPIDWRMIGVLVTLFFAWSGLLIRVLKRLLDKNQKQGDSRLEEINRRLEALEVAAKEETGEWQRVDRDILELRVELAQDYVRRQDFIQVISTLEAKMESLNLKADSIKDSMLNLTSQNKGRQKRG